MATISAIVRMAFLSCCAAIACNAQPHPFKDTVYYLDETGPTLNRLKLCDSITTDLHFIAEHDSFSCITYVHGKKTGNNFYKKTVHDAEVVYLEDMDGDGRREINVCTARNMNGNQWIDVLAYNPATKKVECAGAINTMYELDKKRKSVNITYTGSWYMDNYEEVDEWKGSKLVPLKKLVTTLRFKDWKNDDRDLEVFEYNHNGWVLKQKEKYREDNKRQQYLWDHFFD